MTRILAIDPGTSQSGYVLCDSDPFTIIGCGVFGNYDLLMAISDKQYGFKVQVIEQVTHYGTGMPVGAEVFETVFWAGRFAQAGSPVPFVQMPRRAVKMHLCGSMKAKDTNIHQALVDKFGGKERAVGRKATPGPLYRVKSHAWPALALAVTYIETTLWTDGRLVCDPGAHQEGSGARLPTARGAASHGSGADDHLVAGGGSGVSR